jgi:hypothetical protein
LAQALPLFQSKDFGPVNLVINNNNDDNVEEADGVPMMRCKAYHTLTDGHVDGKLRLLVEEMMKGNSGVVVVSVTLAIPDNSWAPPMHCLCHLRSQPLTTQKINHQLSKSKNMAAKRMEEVWWWQPAEDGNMATAMATATMIVTVMAMATAMVRARAMAMAMALAMVATTAMAEGNEYSEGNDGGGGGGKRKGGGNGCGECSGFGGNGTEGNVGGASRFEANGGGECCGEGNRVDNYGGGGGRSGNNSKAVTLAAAAAMVMMEAKATATVVMSCAGQVCGTTALMTSSMQLGGLINHPSSQRACCLRFIV